MLNDKELGKYADLIIWGMKEARKEGFKKGDIIRLVFSRSSYTLSEIVYEKLIIEGYNVFTQVLHSPKMERSFFDNANKDQLEWNSNSAFASAKERNGNIVIWGDEDLTNLEGVDPEKLAISAKSFKPIREILNKRENEGKFSWTLAMWPTENMAKCAGLRLVQMFNQIKKACFLDSNDPIKEMEEIYTYSKRVCDWLEKMEIETLHLESKNCHLYVKLGKDRKFIGGSGCNIPSFELFTSPDKTGTTGWFYSDQPTYKDGNLVQNINLRFEDGKVIDHEAEIGHDFLTSQLDMDDGSRYIGEFSLTDKRFSKIDKFMADTLYDENVGQPNGNCHIAIGDSYSDTYSGNKEWEEVKDKLNFNNSSLHWDLVNTELKTVTAICKDGSEKIIYKDGEFTL